MHLERLLRIQAFNATYSAEMGKTVAPSDLPQHPRIVERLNQWLEGRGIKLLKEGGFNHYRVAQALLPTLTLKSLGKDRLDAFEDLFKRVNGALG